MTKNKNKTKTKQRKNRQKQKTKTKVIYKEKPMSVGAMIGDGLQKIGTSIFNRITGSGDYKMSPNIGMIKQNSLFNSAKNQPISFSSGMSSFVFEHSEYIGDVISSGVSGGFEIDSFDVSPSDSRCFPWLSNIAENFQQYEVEGMIFRFESTSGQSVASTNTALGNVMAFFSYDYSDELPKSKQALLQYDGCVDARASESFLVGVECAKDSLPFNKLYTGETKAGNDPRMNYKGKFVIASNGIPGPAVNLGELWVHYRIRMNIASTPDINSIGGIIPCALLRGNTVTDNDPWGFTETLQITEQNILTTVTKNEVGVKQKVIHDNLEVGRVYMVQYACYDADPGSSTSFNIGIPVFTGASQIQLFEQGTNYFESTGSLTDDYGFCNFCFQADASRVEINFNSFIFVGGSAFSTYYITVMDASLDLIYT